MWVYNCTTLHTTSQHSTLYGIAYVSVLTAYGIAQRHVGGYKDQVVTAKKKCQVCRQQALVTWWHQVTRHAARVHWLLPVTPDMSAPADFKSDQAVR
jgi:hypothetical protein